VFLEECGQRIEWNDVQAIVQVDVAGAGDDQRFLWFAAAA
jgi:hypothetical protein